MGKSFIYYQHKARLLDSVYVGQLYSLARIAGAEPLGLKFTKKSVRYYFFLIQNKHKKEMTACVSKMLEYVPVISFPRATLYNRTDWHSFQGLNRCANCLTAHPRATPIVTGGSQGVSKGVSLPE